jgi:ribosomal protein S18 acetylase RimI-like enzyme
MFTIRPYQSEDRQQVERCIAEMLNYERVLDKHSVQGEPVAAPYMDWLLAECAQKQGAIFVAEVQSNLVGFVSLYVEYEYDITTDFNQYVYISDFIVSAEHRGAGIGSALLAEAEAYARQIGQKMLKLDVLANNDNALSVYQRFGLKPYVMSMLKELD